MLYCTEGFFQGVGFLLCGFLFQRATDPTFWRPNLIHWGQQIIWRSILNLVSGDNLESSFTWVKKLQRHCLPHPCTCKYLQLTLPYLPPSHHQPWEKPCHCRGFISAAVEGGLSLCSSSDVLPTQVLTRLLTSAYLPRSASMTLCPCLPAEFMPLLWYTATCSWSNDEGGAAKTMEKKAKLSHFIRLRWDATLLSFLEWSKYQLIKTASGTAFLTQIGKSYKKTSTLSWEDAGLNLKRPPSEMNSTTWAGVELFLSVTLSGKIQCQARGLL